MVLVDQDHWMQPGLFATRGKKQREVKARSELVFHDVRWEAHFLSGVFETDRRRHVANTDLGNGLMDRSNLFPGALAAFIGITIELGPTRVLTEDLRGARKYFLHGGIVRQNKRSENFRQRSQAAPFIHWKQRDRFGFLADHALAFEHFNVQRTCNWFSKVLEKGATQFQVERTYFEFAFRIEALDMQFDRFRKGRLGAQRNFQFLPGKAAIANDQFAQHWNGILLKRIIDRGIVGERDANTRRLASSTVSLFAHVRQGLFLIRWRCGATGRNPFFFSGLSKNGAHKILNFGNVVIR